MSYILNKKIIHSLMIEEEETAKRYFYLGKKYRLPYLIEASKDEAKHSEMFRKMLTNGG